MKYYTNQEFYANISFDLKLNNSSTGQINNLPIENNTLLHFTGSNPIVTGLTPTTSNRNIIIYISYDGSGELTLSSQNINSSPQNRISISRDIKLKPKEGLTLIYDSNISRWRVYSQGLDKQIFDIIGNGSNSVFTFTHTFSTRDLNVILRENFGDHSVVFGDVTFPSTSEVRVTFANAPAFGENYKIIVS